MNGRFACGYARKRHLKTIQDIYHNASGVFVSSVQIRPAYVAYSSPMSFFRYNAWQEQLAI
jgi:hypothetical protein